MAITTSSMTSGETVPIRWRNRWASIPRNCRVSTADDFVSPLCESGSTHTCQMLGAKAAFQSVIGATSLIGSRPTPSELTTNAGRVLRISVPIAGSKLTSQTSARLICWLPVVFDNVASLPQLPKRGFVLTSVVVHHWLGLFGQLLSALLNWQTQKSLSTCEGPFRLGFDQLIFRHWNHPFGFSEILRVVPFPNR